jgi:methyl coenzyme M reductase alpha subunit
MSCEEIENENITTPCVAPDLVENIVGTWSPNYSSAFVGFTDDGKIIDPHDILLDFQNYNTDYNEKLYSVISETTLILRAQDSLNPTQAYVTSYNILSNTCDTITFQVLGITSRLMRL